MSNKGYPEEFRIEAVLGRKWGYRKMTTDVRDLGESIGKHRI
jgi:hypothetical protein